MNTGVGAARLIDCMAVRPPGACVRSSPFITKVENAKNTPATRPAPSALTRVRERRNPCAVMDRSEPQPGETVHG
jgi:hypothetical protein